MLEMCWTECAWGSVFCQDVSLCTKAEYCRDKLKCPVCLSTWGCCKPPATTAVVTVPCLCRDFTHTFHSCQALSISVPLPQEHLPHLSWHLLKVGWTTKRCIKLEQTWQEMPHSFSHVWGWGHVQGDGPKSLVCNSLALGRVPPQGQDGWEHTRDDSLERLFVGAYIRDHEPQRILHEVIIAK